MIFVAKQKNIPGALVVGGKLISYATLDDWKADLKSQAAAYVAQPQVSGETALTVTAAATTSAATGANGGESSAKTEDKSLVPLHPEPGASATDASIALQSMLKFQDEISAERLAAAALAMKTSSIPNDTSLKTTATVQTLSMLRTSSRANPAESAGHLNQIA
jgi:hypothetical protein